LVDDIAHWRAVIFSLRIVAIGRCQYRLVHCYRVNLID
jgi:hypothetical protein